MERRRKLSHIASRKHGRSIFSSYDNDTFVPDHEIEPAKRSNVILEKDEGDGLKEGGGKYKESGCTCGIISASKRMEPPCVNEDGKYIPRTCNCRGIVHDNLVSIDRTYNAGGLDDNSNALAPDNLNDHTLTGYNITHETNKRSPQLGVKSLSLDCNTPTPTNTENRRRGGVAGARKMRSFSDTRNPLLFLRFNTKLRQLEEDTADKRRKKYKYQSEVPALSPILGGDDQHEEEESKKTITEPVNIETDKAKGNRRWLRKLARYATFDEGDVYLTKASRSTLDLLPDENAEELNNVDENKTKSDNCDNCRKEGPVQRKISTGKFIKQSMSQGFSKFKQLSISGKSGSRKLEQSYSMIDNDVMLHETSKRIEPLKPDFNIDSTDSEDTGPAPGLRRRCSSMPDCLDSVSVCDEELDDLYLPRRMAICPDLSVPAMKQLRTYLVLTRLKQYCIV